MEFAATSPGSCSVLSPLRRSAPDGNGGLSQIGSHRRRTSVLYGSRVAETRVSFAELPMADLVIDAIYEGGTSGGMQDDPMHRLLSVGLMGGFRPSGSWRKWTLKLVVLYTAGDNTDWPDGLDRESGLFTYYGDNREPGREMHQSVAKGGNFVLRECFNRLHGDPPRREQIPPFFVFEKADPGRRGRDVRFLGLAVPGGRDVQPTDDLVAVWRTKDGQRFQNYRST